MKKVSIIIPVYNASRYLNSCIDSVLSQTYNNIEIILIDDGSTDNSGEICDKFAKLDNRIIVIHKVNAGVSCSRNKGIEIATGDYIFFIDADDSIDKDVVKNLIESRKQSRLVGVNHSVVKNETIKIANYKNNSYNNETFISEVIKGSILGVVWGYLFDANFVKQMKFDLNTSYMEDTIFLIEYLKLASIKSIEYISKNSYYNYYIRENSLTSSNKNVLKKCQEFCYSLEKINQITKSKYEELIENKKWILLEKEMRFCKTVLDYKEIYKEIRFCKETKSTKLKLFSFLYIKKMFVGLKLYYGLRKRVKTLLRR